MPAPSRNAGPLTGNDSIGLGTGATLIFSHPSVPKKLYVHSGANAIKWSYDLNTITTPTIGGEVTQILSCFVGPMTISGQTAGLRTDIEGNPRPSKPGYSSKDSYNPHDELKNIVDWFLTYMHSAGQNGKGSRLRDERAILFQYPERQWDFYIQVTSLDGFVYDKNVYAPEWSITAEVLNDNALNFFRGITMNGFTDTLTSKNLVAGFTGFEGGTADSNNKYFGQTGNSKNPFLNPTISASAADVAKRMGNNFQTLVAAWSTGDFANFGFNALLDNGAKPIDVDAAYQKLFGTTYLGNLPGYSGVGAGVGTTTYNVKSGVQAPPWVSAVLKKGGWPTTTENLAWMAGWGRAEGSNKPQQIAGFNWMNTKRGNDKYPTFGENISIFPTFEIGVQYTVETITQNTPPFDYPDIIAALQSGNPYTNPPLEGLQTWLGGTRRDALTLKYANDVMAMNADVVQSSVSPGVASGVRLTVINWAYKMIEYGKATGRPSYNQAGRKDVENIAVGDFSALPSSDCSNTIALLYCWGTNKNRAFATGSGGTFNGSWTGTFSSNFASKVVPLERLVAGDLIIYGPVSDTKHMDMLLEKFNGDDTLMLSHGSGVPHTTTYGRVSSSRKASARGFQVLPI